MRFKAKLAMEQIHVLYSLISPISRLGSSSSSSTSTTAASQDGSGGGIFSSTSSTASAAVLHLNPTHVRISARGRTTAASDVEGLSCFVELSSRVLFASHRIESAAEDAIAFEMDLGHLRTALQGVLEALKASRKSVPRGMWGAASGVGGGSSALVTMKLAKRNGLPCLCLQASSKQPQQPQDVDGERSCGGMEVHHAIPVRIMRVSEVQHYLPPRTSPPDVQLELPLPTFSSSASAGMNSNRPAHTAASAVNSDVRPSLRVVADRMKQLGPKVLVEASMAGTLALRMDGDGASIRTLYTQLVPRFEECKHGGKRPRKWRGRTPATRKKQKRGNVDGNGNQNQEQEDDDDDDALPARCAVRVDSKKLSACLLWQSTLSAPSFFSSNPDGPSSAALSTVAMVESAVLCLMENEMLVLHVVLHPRELGFLTYYVPVHYMSDDDLQAILLLDDDEDEEQGEENDTEGEEEESAAG